MRKNIFLFSLILFGLLSCKNEKTEKENTSSKTPKILKKNSNPIFSQNDFEMVYEYSNGDSNQLLGINIIDKKNLSFPHAGASVPLAPTNKKSPKRGFFNI
jgi:hypothetical protein